MIRVRHKKTEKEGRLQNVTMDSRYEILYDDGELKDYAESTYERWFERIEVNFIDELAETELENREIEEDIFENVGDEVLFEEDRNIISEAEELEVTPIEEIVANIENKDKEDELVELPEDITEKAKDLYLALKQALPEGIVEKANPTYNLFTINKYSYLAITFQKTGIRVGLNPEFLDEEVLEHGSYFPNWNWAVKFHTRIKNMAELEEWIPTIVELGERIKASRGI